MNLSGYVALDHGHAQGDVFTIISAHIVGMFGLVLVVGDLIDRIGRRRAIIAGLALMAVSRSRSSGSTRSPAMSVALFGLGLGWSFSYVAATAELVTLAGAERARAADRLLRPALVAHGAALALVGGVVYTARRVGWRSAAARRSPRRSWLSSGGRPRRPANRPRVWRNVLVSERPPLTAATIRRRRTPVVRRFSLQ